MADEDLNFDDDLDLQPAEAGAMFKAEMWARNMLLGYWKHIVAVIVAGLLAVLFYGQYTQYVVSSQRAIAAEVAIVESKLPGHIAELPGLLAMEKVDADQLVGTGDTIVGIAENGSGPARLEALLTAAEYYRVAGDKAKRRGVLEQVGADTTVLGYAAASALSNMDLEEGQGEAAADRLKPWTKNSDAFLAQQATINLGLTLEQIGKKGEANAVYSTFLTQWPESTHADEVRRRQARTAGEG